jgi:phosphoribosylformylglycinamidine synthase I
VSARLPAMVLAAPGTNRDGDVAGALEAVGAAARVVALAELRDDPKLLDTARLVVVAGGFSFADALGSGRLFALELADILGEGVAALLAAGRPVLGICNGFQTLVRLGLLPGADAAAVLAPNRSGRFECRWVTLAAEPSSRCVWTRDLSEPITCPVAHGEGRFRAPDATIAAIEAGGQVALRYATADGTAADGEYPANPNGSAADIAGVCDATGLVLGLMPHPENHIHDWQHPRWHRGDRRGNALALFERGVRYAEST